VLYIDLVVAETIFLLTAYAKGDKENISPAERNAYKQIIEQIKRESGGKSHE
jgi:hypothetical protein